MTVRRSIGSLAKAKCQILPLGTPAAESAIKPLYLPYRLFRSRTLNGFDGTAKETMLTAKGKYSLKALVHLAGLEPGETAQAVAIAEAHNIPKKFLDAILGDLRAAGIVYSRKGPGGGYMLARAASEIKVGRVIRAIDGPLAPIACASRTAYQPCRDCKHVKRCNVRLMMTKVRDAMSEVLDQVTIAEMVAMGR
jgi:Rrf2 family protein